MLLDNWRSFEQRAESSTPEQRRKAVEAVQKLMPKRVKKRLKGVRRSLLCEVIGLVTWFSWLEGLEWKER